MGNVAATYLERRGCALPHPDGDLRCLPDHPHPYGHVGPVLVALVTDVETTEPLTLHRTWLARDGSGKAAVDKPRLTLFRHRKKGGVIRLWPDEEVSLGLTLGEGIESCLAGARAGLTPVWSTMDVDNLANFPVLPGLEGLTILVDHDPPDTRGRRAGIAAARTLLQRYAGAGFNPERDLRTIFPPAEGMDAADLKVPA